MSQLSLVFYMSTAHGPIDEELIGNALHTFDLEVVVGWPIEW
jgi:hypothetical protein